MARPARALAVAAVVVLAGLPASAPARAEAEAVPPELAGLMVSGHEVSIHPGFDPTARRFAVRTTRDTRAITVTATTAAPEDELTIAGLPTASGQPRSFTGLRPGEEVTVRVANEGGASSYGLVVTPPGFPWIPVTTHGEGIAPGRLFVTFFAGPDVTAVLDDTGVPVYLAVRGHPVTDFKPQPGSRYSYIERTDDETSFGQPIYEAVVLDRAMRELRRYRTVGLEHTDLHDFLLLPNGHRIHLAYEAAWHGHRLRDDAVVQEVGAGGHEVLRWNSWGDVRLRDNLSGNGLDYAHVNTVDVDTDGNLLVSLRNVSAVVKINRRTGRLMWTFGGRSSDFALDDPLGTFCSQHTAHRLSNGHVLLFDNGLNCPPNGRDRNESRAAEYAIDPVHHTARLVWSHREGIYGYAAGSAQRLANGNTLISWGTAGVLTEVDAGGQVVLEMRPHWGPHRAGMYRAFRAPFPDAIRPRVRMASPRRGVRYAQGRQVRTWYHCVDEGGSSLATCEGTVPAGELLDTSTTGVHRVVVTATDGAGNVRRLTRTYEVWA